MQCKTIAGLALVGLGGYLAYEYLRENGIRDMNSLDARNEWDMRGYLNGLMRGAGSQQSAENQLNLWYSYWKDLRPELIETLNTWYDYGLMRIKVLYGPDTPTPDPYPDPDPIILAEIVSFKIT